MDDVVFSQLITRELLAFKFVNRICVRVQHFVPSKLSNTMKSVVVRRSCIAHSNHSASASMRQTFRFVQKQLPTGESCEQCHTNVETDGVRPMSIGFFSSQWRKYLKSNWASFLAFTVSHVYLRLQLKDKCSILLATKSAVVSVFLPWQQQQRPPGHLLPPFRSCRLHPPPSLKALTPPYRSTHLPFLQIADLRTKEAKPALLLVCVVFCLVFKAYPPPAWRRPSQRHLVHSPPR
jgi:hypothetical protein